MKVKENLELIQNEINEHLKKSPYAQKVNLVAVTKYVSNERALEALDAGVQHFGENRIEGYLEKKNLLKHVTMHFIGTLQTRKVKEVINEVDYLHSLDRLSLANEIEKRADHRVKCFVQVNVSGEASKSGLKVEEVDAFIETIKDYNHIEVVGLMTMAPEQATDEEIYSYFNALKALQLKIEALKYENVPCHELSMGMSNDYKIAVECGATYIRVGTKLVG